MFSDHPTDSQQTSSHPPSRVVFANEHASTQSGLVVLSITGAIALSVLSVIGYKRYRQYRYHQQVKSLERLWQKPYHKRLR